MKLEKEGQIAWNILEQLHCKRKGATGECPTRAPQRSPTSNLLPRFLKSGTYRTAASTLSGTSDHGNKGMILNPFATPSEATAREHLEKIADRKKLACADQTRHRATAPLASIEASPAHPPAASRRRKQFVMRPRVFSSLLKSHLLDSECQLEFKIPGCIRHLYKTSRSKIVKWVCCSVICDSPRFFWEPMPLEASCKTLLSISFCCTEWGGGSTIRQQTTSVCLCALASLCVETILRSVSTAPRSCSWCSLCTPGVHFCPRPWMVP